MKCLGVSVAGEIFPTDRFVRYKLPEIDPEWAAMIIGEELMGIDGHSAHLRLAFLQQE